MYGYSFNTNVDSECFIPLPEGFAVEDESGEITQIRIHETGYIEGDTNGFVEGDYSLHWADSEGDYWRGITEKELLTLLPSDAQATFIVMSDNETGKAVHEAHRFGKTFEYKGEHWRVFSCRARPYHVEKNFRASQFGRNDDWRGQAVLVSYGAITLQEYITQAPKQWKSCGCG